MKMSIIVLFLLTGCVGIGEAVKKAAETTVEFNDNTLSAALVLICDAPSAGALRRRWGNNPGAMEAWQNFCMKAQDVTVVVLP